MNPDTSQQSSTNQGRASSAPAMPGVVHSIRGGQNAIPVIPEQSSQAPASAEEVSELTQAATAAASQQTGAAQQFEQQANAAMPHEVPTEGPNTYQPEPEQYQQQYQQPQAAPNATYSYSPQPTAFGSATVNPNYGGPQPQPTPHNLDMQQGPVPAYSSAQPGAIVPQQPQQHTETDSNNNGAPAQKQKQNTTQSSLLFSEMRENMVIMADGSFRAIVGCESINFDLMSTREREAVEFSYQNFLNSLYFPVQIYIRSQRVDIGPYIERLEHIRRNQDNMLLNILMEDYIGFIDQLAQEANIMDKSFYIVVPYYPVADTEAIKTQATSFFGKLFGGKGGQQQQKIQKIDKVTYEKAKDEISNRVDIVMSGLFQIGIKCYQLNTREIGELYYNVYNPDTAQLQPLANLESSTAMYVRKGTKKGEA